MTDTRLLPYLAATVRSARKRAGLPYSSISVHLATADGKTIADSTVARFEYAQRWPRDPDAMMIAYARALDTDPLFLWREALGAAALSLRRED